MQIRNKLTTAIEENRMPALRREDSSLTAPDLAGGGFACRDCQRLANVSGAKVPGPKDYRKITEVSGLNPKHQKQNLAGRTNHGHLRQDPHRARAGFSGRALGLAVTSVVNDWFVK
jgi:hypothetical protein